VPCLRYLSDYCLFAAEMTALAGQKPKKTWQNPRSPLRQNWPVAQLVRF
jgi:hypothetical protein